MSSQPADVIPVEAVELMGRLLEHSLGETQHITNQLMEAYQDERDEARATIQAIRSNVNNLLDGPYHPSTQAILRALWPSNQEIADWREELAR